METLDIATDLYVDERYSRSRNVDCLIQYLTLYSVNMTYNPKKSIIQWESVCICISLLPRRGSLSAQCVVLYYQNLNSIQM